MYLFIRRKFLVVPFYQKEVSSSTDYSDCLESVDCVIHCAARVHIMDDSVKDPLLEYREVNTYGTINLAKQAAEAGVKRFIFISSIKVNGEATSLGSPFTEQSPRLPQDHYSRSKSEAEEGLIELSKRSSLEVVIIRPTLVYGPGVKANFASLMKLVSKGFPLPFRSIDKNLRSLVSVKNVSDLITKCITHPKASNQIFLVSDDHDVSTFDMVRYMSMACGKNILQIPIPLFIYILLGKLCRKELVINRLIGSLQVDISHTRKTLEWMPIQSLEEGFRDTANYILRRSDDT